MIDETTIDGLDLYIDRLLEVDPNAVVVLVAPGRVTLATLTNQPGEPIQWWIGEEGGVLVLRIAESGPITRQLMERVSGFAYAKNDREPVRLYTGGEIKPWSQASSRIWRLTGYQDTEDYRAA